MGEGMVTSEIRIDRYEKSHKNNKIRESKHAIWGKCAAHILAPDQAEPCLECQLGGMHALVVPPDAACGHQGSKSGRCLGNTCRLCDKAESALMQCQDPNGLVKDVYGGAFK